MPAENKAGWLGRELPQVSNAELVATNVVCEDAPVTAIQVVGTLDSRSDS